MQENQLGNHIRQTISETKDAKYKSVSMEQGIYREMFVNIWL